MSAPSKRQKHIYTAKECAYLAVFVAILLAAQFVLSFVPGVEIVTVLFTAYAFTFGIRRGMIAATAFTLLRQILFGVFPTVLVLYLVYFNLLALAFGGLGKRVKNPVRALVFLTLIACLCTISFTLLDNIITPVWYGYSWKATKLYFYASLPVMLPQVVCTAVSVFFLFLPLHKAFALAKRKL